MCGESRGYSRDYGRSILSRLFGTEYSRREYTSDWSGPRLFVSSRARRPPARHPSSWCNNSRRAREEGMKHATMEELEAGFEAIRGSPAEEGVLALIVRRPNSGRAGNSGGRRAQSCGRSGGRQLEDPGQLPDRRRLTASRHATEHHECAGDGAHRAGQGPLAVVRRSTIHRHRLERRKSAGRNPARHRFGRDRGDRSTSHQLQNVCSTVWVGRDELRQFTGGQTTSPSWDQRQGRTIRRHSGRRMS